MLAGCKYHLHIDMLWSNEDVVRLILFLANSFHNFFDKEQMNGISLTYCIHVSISCETCHAHLVLFKKHSVNGTGMFMQHFT